MSASAPAVDLAVVVPCYNEARSVGATLHALAEQSDRGFRLVVVDNASTDATPQIVAAFRAARPALETHCVHEPQKGTGRAADTGFRYAIERGATHIARTDADCLPRRDWVASLKRAFAEGADFVAGSIRFRADDCALGWHERAGVGVLAAAMTAVAPLLPHNRGAGFKTRYVLASGGNLATTAEAYLLSGGFPRIGLEDDNEDRVLVNRIRRVTHNVKRDRRVVVYQSARRIKRYGLKNSLLWYMDRRYKPEQVDIR